MKDIKPPFIRSPYNYDLKEASDETAYVETMPSLTVQSMTEDADINVIVKRFGLTGQLPENARPVFFGDFTEVVDFRSAHDAVIRAEQSFMEMPADVRARFGNDPQQFMEFCSATDDGKTLKNITEMRKMGLAIPEKEAQNVPVAKPPETEKK